MKYWMDTEFIARPYTIDPRAPTARRRSRSLVTQCWAGRVRSAWRRGRPPSSAPRVEIAGDENPAPTDMPIVPR
jgi:hypothetical protein